MEVTFQAAIPSCLLMIFIQASYSYVEGRNCRDHNDCFTMQGFFCKDGMCACDPHSCDGPTKTFGDRCNSDHDCYFPETNLVCLGKNADHKTCRCRKMHMWDTKYSRCMKQEDPDGYDPVQNFIIPAIIVMSVGAMVYLGIKLFCNCGKLWRRRRSQLTRELEGMNSSSHQQATWVASYRVFSPLNNSNRPPLHPTPCMGLFVPSQTISQSPPPYEEALKHKVILSSYHPTAPGPQLPLYAYAPPNTIHESAIPVIVTNQGNRVPVSEGDQMRPLRYYPGDGNPEIPSVWSSIRTNDRGEEHIQEIVRPNTITTFRDPRNGRTHRSAPHRRYSPEPPREAN